MTGKGKNRRNCIWCQTTAVSFVKEARFFEMLTTNSVPNFGFPVLTTQTRHPFTSLRILQWKPAKNASLVTTYEYSITNRYISLKYLNFNMKIINEVLQIQVFTYRQLDTVYSLLVADGASWVIRIFFYLNMHFILAALCLKAFKQGKLSRRRSIKYFFP